jgi:hypothetical protein
MIYLKLTSVIVAFFLGRYATYYFNVKDDDSLLFKLSMILIGAIMAWLLTLVMCTIAIGCYYLLIHYIIV